ncbi:MAG: class GN sortase [Alphaproteobacteria bacterium]
MRLWLGLPLLALGVWQAGQGLYIPGKAAAAQLLLRAAWERTRHGDVAARPWPWADTWPVARLEVPRLGIDEIVLASATGRSLAFAPGHIDGTAMPGTNGTTVIGGHRDTHFRFLRDLVAGDVIRLSPPTGDAREYRVMRTAVVEQGKAGIVLDAEASRLVLVTCWPFDALVPGGPLRYAVTAESVRPGESADAPIAPSGPIP